MTSCAHTLPVRAASIHNRIAAILIHCPRYAFMGLTRLATDAGVSKGAVSRLIRGERRPSYVLVTRVVAAIERELGRPLDLREVVREDENYPTASPCALAGCPGCLPNWAYDESDGLRPEFEGVPPGGWSQDGPVSLEED
jgi:transcriptional regulator with XRE-family HTH domain